MKRALLVLLTTVPASAELSVNAGQILMDSFRCESSNGSAVQQVRSSLTSLKETIEKVAKEQKECAGDLAAVGKLPEVESIIRQIDNYAASEELKRAEGTITEALNDLAVVRAMPPGHPDRPLYPDEAVLQELISAGRTALIKLRVSTRVQLKEADRKRYLDGVHQLDMLTAELAKSLSNGSKCFQRNPVLKRQVLTGLVGISGFFASLPGGIAITLAGRLLQNVFDIADAAESGTEVNFQSAHQTMLAAGLACTMETLGTQHCRLIRQHTLLQAAVKGPCQGKECSAEMMQVLKLVEGGKTATDAVTEVTSWLAGKTDSSSDQAMAQKINSDFLSAVSQFESKVGGIAERAKQAEGSSLADVQRERQASQLREQLQEFASKIYGKNPYGDGSPGGGSEDLESMFTKSEKADHALQLIFNDQELAALKVQTESAIASSQRLRQKFDVEGAGGIAGSKTVPEAAMIILNQALRGANIVDVPTATAVTERLQDRVGFDRIKGRLATYKSQILRRTALPPKDEQLGNFIMAFTHEELGRPSTLKNLESVQKFMQSLPPDFVKSRDPILKISKLKQEVADVVEMGQRLDSGQVEMSAQAAEELFTRVNKLLDPGRGFKDQIANLSAAATSYQIRAMTKDVSNPSQLNDLVFLQNREFVEQVYDLKTGYQKKVDYKTAIALSASQIESFGSFFEKYLPPALQMLNSRDIRGQKFSNGLSQNIDSSLKDHFCIQALSLTEMPQSIRTECASAEIKSESGTLKFADHVNRPHPERVCAYRTFLHTQKYRQFNRTDSQKKAD